MFHNIDKNFIPKRVLKQLLSGRLQSGQEPPIHNGLYGGWDRRGGNRGWEDWEIEDMQRPAYELTKDGHWRKVNC